MNIIAFILFLIAAVLFFVAERPVVNRYSWANVPLGLFFLTVGFIVQFCTSNHTVTF